MGRTIFTSAVPLVFLLGLLGGCGGQGTPAVSPPAQESAPQSVLEAAAVRDVGSVDGEKTEYLSMEPFLREQGFDGAAPFYDYQDQEGNLQLVLYYDESTGAGCGIRYIPSDYGDERLEGFTFDATIPAADSEDSVYSASHWDRWKTGYTALPVWEGGAVEDYQEACVEDESGRVTSFESSGMFEGYGTEGRLWVYSAQFTYDDNGTLRQRHLGQNPQLFGTHDSSWDSYFDTQGRVCYERGYLTHGSQEYYYIYTDDGMSPAYCLYLDENCGVWWPEFAAY